MNQQRGVALITAMLLMALITTLTYSLKWDNELDLRRTYVSMFREEAIQAALGAESWVLTILRQDAQDSQTDHLGEIWASEFPVLPVGGPGDSIQGEIYGDLTDLSGRFNINNLVNSEGEVDQGSLEQFQRLLLALGLDVRLAGFALDWIDADRETSFPDGAEDSLYTGIIPPYRTANQILSSPSELAALEGMDKDTMDILLPHITALPGRQSINVNTATAAVLQSLDENISLADVESLLAEREAGGFTDINKSFGTLIQDQDVINQLAETSDYFQLKVVVRVDTVRITYYSVLERSPQGDTTPILRTLGTI